MMPLRTPRCCPHLRDMDPHLAAASRVETDFFNRSTWLLPRWFLRDRST